MNTKPKSKWYWRLLRWGLIGLAVLVTLVAIAVTEEDWRGRHAWESYKHAAEARGEHFDWAFYTPTNIPDDQNFFCAPVMAAALNTNEPGPAYFGIYRGDSKLWPTDGGNWQKQKMVDLKTWQQYFRAYNATSEGSTNGFRLPTVQGTPAADVLVALGTFDAAREQVRQASLRPYAWLPLHYENGFEVAEELMPALAYEKRCGRFFQLRALAELADGRSDLALDDVKLLLAVTDSMRTQPFLISHFVRLALFSLTMQPIYEGLAQHRWNDAQLAEMEAALAKEDLLADFQTALRGERTCAIDSFENQRLTRKMEFPSEENGVAVIVTNSMRLMPSAYFYQNELAFAQVYEQFILPMVDLTNHTVSVASYKSAVAENERRMKTLHYWSLYAIQSLMVFPAVAKSVEKFAAAQGDINLARTACALERYRLAHGEYPPALDALAPQDIEQVPHDVINGQPLHYQRTDDGKFVLYSVGWNETDDGGTVVLNKNGSVNREKGDWVWKY